MFHTQDIDECISESQVYDNKTTKCMDTKAVIFVFVDKATLVVWMYGNVKVH